MRPLQMLRRLLTGIALVTVLVAVSWVSSSNVAAAVTTAASRKAAPDYALVDSKGAPVRLSDYKGKVVLLDFWATWCTGCKVEIPWYMEFETKYKDRGLVSIGVAMDDEGWTLVNPYLEQHPINYPIVIGVGDFAKLHGITAMPVTLLIDREGRIADSHVGVVVKSSWEREIRTLLQERAKK
jgi:peroxiredoxin